MKVLMIDPWGVNNTSMYTNGLCAGLSKHVELTLYTNCYYEKNTDAIYRVNKKFFKFSEKMAHGKWRKVIRGIEYITAYRNIMQELKKEPYDVVHIQWLLLYEADIRFLKRLKKYCNKLVYTAHNVVPHTNGEMSIEKLKIIYDIVDIVLLHGEGTKDEFEAIFPEFKSKVIIQRHGVYLNQDVKHDTTSINSDITGKVKKFDKVFIFFGHIYYNKGVDRLINIWLENFKDNKNQLLIIAGKKSEKYKELAELEMDILSCDNILYINKFVENNLLNYLIDSSNLILLPYRHASMSGVIFTAAEFKKSVLCTDTGSISEYLINEDNSFISENRDDSFCEKLKFISNEINNEALQSMGEKLHAHINNNYSWDKIGKKIVESVYKL